MAWKRWPSSVKSTIFTDPAGPLGDSLSIGVHGSTLVLALAAFLAWRRSAPREPAPAPAAAAPQPAPLPAAEPVTPPLAPRPQLAVPAMELAKRVEIRPTRNLAPGALEGIVLDAETN